MPLCLHESAHAMLGLLFGRKLKAVSAHGGVEWAGCTIAEPVGVSAEALEQLDPDAEFILWPPEVRRRIESDLLYFAAGGTAEHVLSPQDGRVSEPVSIRAAAIAATLPAPTADERAQVLKLVSSDAGRSDAEHIAALASVAYPGDEFGQARWLAYMAAECEVLVLRHAAEINRLAAVVQELRVVHGAAAASVLKRRHLWSTA